MLSHDAWLKIISELIEEIASPEQQKSKWFGAGPLYSSPTEVYNQLFDDYTFDLFYETYSGGFTAQQERAWTDLKRALEDYGKHMPPEVDPDLVFHDPAWRKVGKTAHTWLAAFSHV